MQKESSFVLCESVKMSLVVKNIEDFEQLTEQQLEELYSWVDTIPLSRPKRNINRDFSDGVLTAEVVKHFLPKGVDIHNYTAASSTTQKMENWDLLNRKVFKKLNFQLSQDSIRAISTGKQFSIERFLMYLQTKINRAVWELNKETDKQEKAVVQQKGNYRMHPAKGSKIGSDQPEADQNIALMPSPQTGNYKAHQKMPVLSPGRQKGVAPAGPYRGTKMKPIDDMIPVAIYEEKEQECLAKEETIQILQAKVRRLEHLLHLKDIRIDDLQSRLENNRPTGNVRR